MSCATTTIARFGRPEDVARAVRFLLEPDSYITGHVITVDGGLTPAARPPGLTRSRRNWTCPDRAACYLCGVKPASTTPVEARIVTVRGRRVMLSTDLAALYGVEPRSLHQAVKRNGERFPADFMFRLSRQELANLRSQTVMSSWGGARRAPLAFTQEGVAMLSSVLRSPQAVRVNVEIMRAFVRLRVVLADPGALARRLNELEARYDRQFKMVFDAIRALMTPAEKPAARIGFRPESD